MISKLRRNMDEHREKFDKENLKKAQNRNNEVENYNN